MEISIYNCNFELSDEVKAKNFDYTENCDMCKHHDLCFKDVGIGKQDFTGWKKKKEFNPNK